MLAHGDLVILVTPRGKRTLRRIEEGKDVHSQEGIVLMTDLIQSGFGSYVISQKGTPFLVQEPTLYDLVRGVKRLTQIIYPKDIAQICFRLGVGEGRTFIEAGSGSGSLTIGLSWFAGKTGHVYTYEAREEFYKNVKKNLEWAGLGHNVTQVNKNIEDGFDHTGVDGLFLDVRTPWLYLDQVIAAVRSGAQCAFLLPTIDQVGKLLAAMEVRPFADIEVSELLLRKWKTVPDRLRPDDRMVAHTGFLVFARHQQMPDNWDEFIPQGTRERKQIAAKQQRLAMYAAQQAQATSADNYADTDSDADAGDMEDCEE